MSSNFERLAAINVNEQVEKKGGLSYLSWAWAVDRLLRADPEARWHYHEMVWFADRSAMVVCTVKAFGVERTCHLPVMDYKNRAIKEPDAFAVNTAMQRCLVKAIALHGLGLYIYAGEDVPPGEEHKEEGNGKDPGRPNTATQVAVDAFEEMSAADQKYLHDQALIVMDLVDNDGGTKAHNYIEAQKFSTEQRLGLWSLLPSQTRSALQKVARAKAPNLVAPPLASQP